MALKPENRNTVNNRKLLVVLFLNSPNKYMPTETSQMSEQKIKNQASLP